MPANQRRYAQAIPLVYICIAVAVCAYAATFGIKMLMLKQQLKQGSERLTRLRRELTAVNTSNEALRTKKDQLTSVPALTRAIQEGVIRMVPIEDRFVVTVPASRRSVATLVSLPDIGEDR